MSNRTMSMPNTENRKSRLVCAAVLLSLSAAVFPSSAMAWWNDAWPYRLPVEIDASAKGANLTEDLADQTVLLRFHTGNFSDFFLIKDDASDIRFVAGDDKTPLKYHIDNFDPVNQLLYVWVNIPAIKAGVATEKIWMYYGNAEAVAASDLPGSYDSATAAAVHFKTGETLPKDATAYSNHASQFGGELNAAGFIGNSAKFNGKQVLQFADSPSMTMDATKGVSASVWIKPADPQSNAWILHRGDGAHGLTVIADVNQLMARLQLPSGVNVETPKVPALKVNEWQQVSVTVGNGQLQLFVNDQLVASSTVPADASWTGGWTFANDLTGAHGFIGEMDEVRIDGVARSPAWIKANSQSQIANSSLLKIGPTEQLGAGEAKGEVGFLSTIINHTDAAGWSMLFFMLIMAIISWIIMVTKALYLRRVRKDNSAFLQQYHKIGQERPDVLDVDETEEDVEYGDSPILQSLFGKHDHYQSSSLYKLYHRGAAEVKSRLGRSVGANASGLTPAAIESIRAALDAEMIRETQRLGSQMVMLTISVSGGPFLGLLGTVLGVMITFGAIAASGDVNIAAIAPGMTAALACTAGGLFVAIPALFAYNYFSVQNKDIIADMRVFADEYLTRIAEYYVK